MEHQISKQSISKKIAFDENSEAFLLIGVSQILIKMSLITSPLSVIPNIAVMCISEPLIWALEEHHS